MLATILQTELGGSLFVPDAADAKATWKSPQELQRKILLRTSVSSGIHAEMKRNAVRPCVEQGPGNAV